MAGVKGRSGGARANSGGTRPGAGRKPKPKVSPVAVIGVASITGEIDMLDFLQCVALGRIDASPVQVRAAIAAIQYTHIKRDDAGKKEEVADRAKGAAGGKFKPAPSPLKLVRT